MNPLKKSLIERSLVTIHYLAMLSVFLVCWVVFYRIPAVNGEYFVHNRTIAAAYTLLLFAMSRIYSCYKVGFFRKSELVYNHAIAELVSWGITYVLACIMAQKLLNPLMGFCALAIQMLITVVWVSLANIVYFRIHKPKKTVVVFRNESDLSKLSEIENFKKRWDVLKTVQCMDSVDAHDLPGTGADEVINMDICEILEAISDYETVFVSGINASLRNGIVKFCLENNMECFFVPHVGDVIVSGGRHAKCFSVPIIRTRRSSQDPEYLLVKRAFDIVMSLIAIVLLSPLMAATAIAIKAYDKGPALYKQVRLTKDGKQFKMLKFRSMRIDAEKDGVARLSSGDKDERITPIGRFIRAIRFDELPQLFNILLGDMSIVGPRPERPEIAAQYEEILPAFRLRLQVKAGLTGYAQVYGKYNTAPEDKLKMDLMYINEAGITSDLKLMLATVRVLFMRESTEGVEVGQTTAMGQGVQNSADKEANFEEAERETTRVG